MTTSPTLLTKPEPMGFSPVEVQSPTTDDITPEDILNETGRLSAALETFCDLLRSKQSNLASAYQTYEALWNHYILLLRLFDDHRWKSRMRKDGDKAMIHQIERGFTKLLPVVKQAKVALNEKMKDAAQVLAVVQNPEGDHKSTAAAIVKDIPETPRSPLPQKSRFNLFSRRRAQSGITTEGDA